MLEQQEEQQKEREEQQRQQQDDMPDRQETQQEQQEQPPRSMLQPTPSSSTAVALAGCAAAVVVAVIFTVVFSVLRGGVAGVLLAITFSAPAILLFLGLSVWAGARYCPLLLGLVVQVAAVEVVRLSGIMADDDDQEENESWTGMRGERRAVRIGKEWAEGRLAECRHDRWRKQQREGEERAAGRGGRMRRRRQRRLVVEWVDGQMFLVIHRPIASQWLVSLVNRYMHGPIPMKAESCRAEMLRVCISPAELLRLGSVKASVVGLRVFGRRTHEDEWDEAFYYEKAIKFRRWAADYVQALIEGTYGRRMKAWGFIVDSLINNITFVAKDVHLRIDDRWEGHCFGILVDHFTCEPGEKEPESLGATPHEFSVAGVLFYVDAHNEISRSPECPAITVEEGTFRVEFPDIFRTLILNREIMPGGRGKRLRVRGEFFGMLANVQANQMRTYLFSLLGTFCPYKYSAWKAAIREQAALDCRPVSAVQRWQYLQTFGTLREEKRLSTKQQRERLAKLAELERYMSYRDILLLRKEARGWRLEDMGEPPPTDDPPLDPDFMRDLTEGDPQYEELVRYAARIQSLQLSAWEVGTCLREIMVQRVVVHRVEARLCQKADPDRDGPENRAFQTPVQAVLFASEMEGRFRMFIGRTKASRRLHSRGANGVDGEPALPWLMSAGSLTHPVVLDEATAARLGYGSTCILSPGRPLVRGINSAGEGVGHSEGVSGGTRDSVAEDGPGNDGDVPKVGGTFRMWSDYRMSLEGNASNVQAGTLLPPVLEVARTVADSFRRRWAAGGQYPELKLALVRLAEQEGGRRGEGDMAGMGGENDETPAVATVAATPQPAAASQRWRKIASAVTRAGQAVASRSLGQGPVVESRGAGDGSRCQSDDTQEGEPGESSTSPRDQRKSGERRSNDIFRQALFRLDTLDNGALVEEALEDLHDEERLLSVPSAASTDGVSQRRPLGPGGSSHSDLQRVAEEAPATMEGVARVTKASAGLPEDTMVADDMGDDPAEAVSEAVAEAAAAQAASGGSTRPVAEKFMLPGWHYLYLSGRSLSMDIRWSNVDLLLMQDPTVRSGRHSGKNILAFRSSGALTMRSSGPGESVDLQLNEASLLPCFYSAEEDSGATSDLHPDASRRRGHDRRGDGEDVPELLKRFPVIAENWRSGDRRSSDGVDRVGGDARCLAQLLGGGDRVLAAVARTWLGQGLATADSRPLLEPFSVQCGYGTVVAQSSREGHGSGVDAIGHAQLSDESGPEARDGEGDVDEGRVLTAGVDGSVDGQDEQQVKGGRVGDIGNEETVAGVFRVAVSELQLLAGETALRRSAIMEVEVEGQTRTFLAASVAPSTSGEENSVELEFACRCRLRRRRRQRPSRVSGPPHDLSPTAATCESLGGDSHTGIDPVAVEVRGENSEQIGEQDDDDEGEDQPEAAANIRLRDAGGQVLGEAWAELPGAPKDWARYPLYAPGSAAITSQGAGVEDSHDDKGSGLERGEVIPAPPGTLRRRWGWGGGTTSKNRGESRVTMSALARYRPWFRPQRIRDVAGDIKLRLGWVPSGLAVSLHGWRDAASTAQDEGAGNTSLKGPQLRHVSEQRRSVVVSVEPGGASVDARIVQVEGEMSTSSAEPVEGQVAGSGIGSLSVGGTAGDANPPAGVVAGERQPSSIAATENEANSFAGIDAIADETSESFFFSLDPACLLGDVESALASNVGGDGGGMASSGGGARLILSTNEDVNPGPSDNSRGVSSDAGSRAELLLFAGADPARRWVPLTDRDGQVSKEIDISISWALAAPAPLASTDGDSGNLTGEQGKGSDTAATLVAGAATGLADGGAAGAKTSAGGLPLEHGPASITAGQATPEVRTAEKIGVDGVVDGSRNEKTDADGAGIASTGVSTGVEEAQDDEERFPEPAQVVARYFTVQASDLVLRVSDLDVAVLVTMAKSIVRVFKPPQSKEEKELELEAVQQRLLEEANAKRNAAIQQLRAAFQHTPSGASQGTQSSIPGEAKEEFLNVRDVVELLRDFLRAKALTESEISREAEEFMVVVLAVADAAKCRTPARGRARSESPARRRSSSDATVLTNPADDFTATTTPESTTGGGLGDGSEVAATPHQWVTRLRPEWKRREEKLSTSSSNVEGFICPQCRKKLNSPAALLAHFHIFHGGSGGLGGAGEGESGRFGSGGGGGSSSVGGGVSEGSGDEAERGVSRRGSRRGYHGASGGNISLDHFILALQSFMEEQPHEGYVVARCEEFASTEIERGILSGYPSLPHRLAGIPPADPLPEFWEVMKHEVGVTPASGGGQQVRVVQIRMVRALKNYAVARSAWAHLVVPALWGVPRCGSIKTTSGRVYLPMPCPVREGQSFYVDKPAMVITRLPQELSGVRDKGEGKAGGEAGAAGWGGGGGGVMLTGIMTNSQDRGSSGVRAFLTFTLDSPAVVYVCYDQRLKRLPVWLMYFEKTGWVVRTTEGPFGVWRKRYTRGTVRLGCNEGWRKGCSNYFLLIGADDPFTRLHPTTGTRGSSVGFSTVQRQKLSPPQPAPPPPPSPSPTGLLPDADRDEGTGTGAGGGSTAVSPRWVLRPHMVAGGKGSLAQAVRALVDERRKSRAMSRSQLLPGGESRTQLDEAAATAAELGLELAPVEFHYTGSVNLGSVSFRVVDPTAAEIAYGVKAEVCLSHVSGNMMLRHLHPGDWLGVPDSLTLRASTGGGGTYYNPLVDAREHCIEPWAGVMDCHSDRGKATTDLRVEMPEHLVVNLTSALVESVKSIAALVARNWTGRYTEPVVSSTEAGGGGGSLIIRNTLGIAVVVEGASRRNDEGPGEEWGPSSRSRAQFGLDDTSTEREGIRIATQEESVSRRNVHRPIPRDVSQPTTVPAGQAIECRLPSVRRGSRDGDGGGFGAAAELTVYVPGFCTVRRVRVGSRSTQAYPLFQLAAESGPGGGGRASAEKAARLRRGLALVVEVREEGGASGGNGGSTGVDDEMSPRIGGGVLVAELRSNVCLHNASASGVEVEIGSTAMAASGESSGAMKGSKGRSGQVRGGWTSGADAAPVFKLAPGARLALPLSVLSSWQLRLVGDATDTRVRPLRLSPALLDPAVPNALRLTGDMERNSMCLKLAKSGVRSAAELGESHAFEAAPPSPKRGGASSSNRQSPGTAVSSEWSEAGEQATSKAGSSAVVSRAMPPSTSVAKVSAALSDAADWVLTVQPSYLITNTLPCTLEVEILQPKEIGISLGTGGSGTDNSRVARSRGGSDVSDSVGQLYVDGSQQKDEWSDNASNSDAGSAASWSTSTTRQSSSGAKPSGSSSGALPSKAAVRNPALDLFFLPTAVGSDESGGPSGRDGGTHACGSGRRGSVETGAGGGGDCGKAVGWRQKHALWLESQKLDKDGKGSLESTWKGLVRSGQDAKVGRVDTGRPFYFRVRLPDTASSRQSSSTRAPPPCCQWSDIMVINTSEYAKRVTFNARHPEDVTWRSAAREGWGRPTVAAAAEAAAALGISGKVAGEEAGRARRQQCPEVKAARSWGRSSARRLTFYAPYWIVNKTGLALNYRAGFVQKTFKILSHSSKRKYQEADRGSSAGGGGHVDIAASLHNGDRERGEASGGGSMHGGTPESGFHESSRGEYRGHVSSAEETAIAQLSRVLLQDATYVSDEEHLAFFGGRSLPVMLGCPATTLEVMPYALAGRAEDPGLCVCDLRVSSDSSSLYYCQTNPGPSSRLYTDCAVYAAEFPAAIAELSVRSGSVVQRLTAIFAVFRRGGRMCHVRTDNVPCRLSCLSFVFKQILTPWREPPAPEKEAFMTFWLTRDALVHVCLDSRTPPGKRPSWLEYAGFRRIPDATVRTSEPELSLQVYRRFFRARTLIKLGGSDNGRDLATALTDFSGAAATPDGPAPKSMLANYTVLLTTVPPPTLAPQPPTPDGTMPQAPEVGWSPLNLSGGADEAPAGVPAARYEEADVRDALVDRDVGESIVCRRRYRILPDFGAGDRPYVDREYTIPELPTELQGLRLTCVQTAQGDKRAGGSRLWRLSLMQDSIVLVVFDARATSVPQWLAASGFTSWEGVEVAGAEYRLPYVYKVYRKRCRTGLVWLGGNGAKGCKGAKRGYFVLIYAADRPIEAASSPKAAPQSLSSPHSSTLVHAASSDGTGVTDKEPRIRGGGGPQTIPQGHDAREPEVGIRPLSSRSRSSRSSTGFSFDGDRAGGRGGGDEDDDDSVVSAPSTPGSRPSLLGGTINRSRSAQALGDALEDAAAETGGVKGNSVTNRERRSMSTTSYQDITERAATSRGRGNRNRAWTGGEASSAWSADLRAFAAENDALARPDAGGGHGRPSEARERGLQRISAVWNSEKDGPLSQIPVPFDRVGRRWSRTFNVDAANTAGPLETSGATLGVSVSALTGQFHRTRVVTLYPRLIVRNFLGIPLEVMPTVMSPKAAAVTKLSRCLPDPPSPSRRHEQQHGHQRFGSGGIARGPTTAAEGETAHLAQAVPTSSAVIVYGFNPADQLVKGLVAAARAAGRPVPATSGGGGAAGDTDDHRKCILVRAATAAGGGGAVGSGGSGSGTSDAGGFGSALASGLSRPVLAEEMGETHLWVVDSRGRRHLATAFVSLQRATVFITLSASAQFPPFRVENRSSMETLVYRQEDADRSMGWHVLPPLTWHAFLWQEPNKPRAIEVAFAGVLSNSHGGAKHSEVYSLDKIGESESLGEKEASITRSVLTLVATGMRVKRLSSEVRVEGRTRVLSFGDVRLAASHAQGTNADSVTRMKRLYTQLDVGVRIAGLSFNVVECKAEGPVELMSAHVDSVTVAKRSDGNRVEVQMFHFQVDDMRRRTQMPIVLQPANSGFNSHLRGSAGEVVGAVAGTGTGGGSVGGSQSAAPVPVLRILYEREVATLSMPHLKSLDIELQEMHAHVDLEFVLHLLNLAGALLPELSSEEVLAKMCRKKAKLAVRHTVPIPAKRDLSMVYLEAFRHSTIVVRLELLVGQGALSPDAAALEDPEATTGGLTVLGGGFLTVLSVLGSSLAHVNPTFVFDELVVTHYCGGLRGLISVVLTALTQQAVAQGYKVVGSMELLGDPLSLVSKLGDSVVQFLSKTSAELTGSADTVGAGAKVLVKGLVGGTFGSAAKITGSLEGMIRGLSGTAILEDDVYSGRMGDGGFGQGEVKDLEHGMKQGGKVFYESMRAGLSGLVDRPMEGAKDEGFAGFIAGMAKGIVGAVAAPVAGALGAVTRAAEGVDASTRLSDEKRMGRRRAARTLVVSSYSTGRALTPLTPTDLVKHVPRQFATLWVGTANGHRASSSGGVVEEAHRDRQTEE